MRCNSIFFNLKYSSYLYKSYIEDSHVEDNYCIILVLTLPLFCPFCHCNPFHLILKKLHHQRASETSRTSQASRKSRTVSGAEEGAPSESLGEAQL